MTTYIFNKQQLKIKEKIDQNEVSKLFERYMNEGLANAASKAYSTIWLKCKEHPCHPSCADVWEDNTEVKEGEDFELRRVPEEFKCIAIHELAAYPLPKQESEDELWDNVIGIVLHATANDCANDLKQYFTIKRKP